MSESVLGIAPPSVPAEDAGRLRERYQEIAQVIGGLAHELRNPLSTMSLNLELMAEDLEGAESTRDKRLLKKVERVRKESRRLQTILEEFLRFARVPELRGRTRPLSLNDVVEDLRDFYEPQAIAHGVILRTLLAEDLPLASVDEDLFKQALLNLVLNAQHAMPSGGEVLLITRVDGPNVALDVVDTGCGIPLDEQIRIFEPFYSTRPGGTGLGLSTTRKIIEAHGGSIELVSEPGRGSKFTIRLPITLGLALPASG